MTKYRIEVELTEDDPSEVLDQIIAMTGDEDASVEAECPGSGRPVEGGSRCRECGLSFGWPHPANLVVGRPAPAHFSITERTHA